MIDPHARVEAATSTLETAGQGLYGTGSLYVRTDSAGRETWYGHWRADGRQIKRRVGPKRTEGTRDGLTRRQAEAELRRLIVEVKPPPRVTGDALTIDELATRYVAHLRRQDRKKATITAVESIVKVWLSPFFGERDLRGVTTKDVEDLMRRMEEGNRPGPRQKGDRRYGKPAGPSRRSSGSPSGAGGSRRTSRTASTPGGAAARGDPVPRARRDHRARGRRD